MIGRPPRSTLSSSSAASDVYKRQLLEQPQKSVGRGRFGLPVDFHLAFSPFERALFITSVIHVNPFAPLRVHLVQHAVFSRKPFDANGGIVVQPQGEQIAGYGNGLHARFQAVVPGPQERMAAGLVPVGTIGRGRHGHGFPSLAGRRVPGQGWNGSRQQGDNQTPKGQWWGHPHGHLLADG
eukprot:TRINITY_DN8870_c0_g2_i2.p4 TRINITY_DN8870_c0_g2~~TRINITY_DN8870_c0_g2_i2.p4  ORF type:complete len:181 (+),score=39.09 TRINITY_DN8870_c0_g2_i2:101-643(+)